MARGKSATPLLLGNTAKLYCLEWIERNILRQNPSARILDLGCGEGGKFLHLLERFPDATYVGVEPDPLRARTAANTLAAFPGAILARSADRLDRERPDLGHFDVVTSFSVLEHIADRPEYLRVARAMLADGGRILINYDAGHFSDPRQRLKNTVGPILARFGVRQYYQSPVREEEFRSIAALLDLTIEEERFFNTANLKRIFKLLPADRSAPYMRWWLDAELQLNDAGIVYNDGLSNLFLTRNFILQRRTNPLSFPK